MYKSWGNSSDVPSLGVGAPCKQLQDEHKDKDQTKLRFL